MRTHSTLAPRSLRVPAALAAVLALAAPGCRGSDDGDGPDPYQDQCNPTDDMGNPLPPTCSRFSVAWQFVDVDTGEARGCADVGATDVTVVIQNRDDLMEVERTAACDLGVLLFEQMPLGPYAITVTATAGGAVLGEPYVTMPTLTGAGTVVEATATITTFVRLSGLGQRCDGDNPCPGAMDCVGVSDGFDIYTPNTGAGYCSPVCATVDPSTEFPPGNAWQTCRDNSEIEDGFYECILYDHTDAGPDDKDHYCTIDCDDDGACPHGLTCGDRGFCVRE
jgi:hypothetical protein